MTIWVERLTAADWTAKNPVLEEASLGYESDTNKHKIGDGETAWNDLPYAGSSMLDAYPVGSVYISVSSTNPGTLFGGTWQAFAQGRMLVGLKPTDVDFDTVEETGGSKYST